MACTVCSGSKEEHFDAEGKQITIHAYTELEGDLVTQEQDKKRRQQKGTLAGVPISTMVNAQPNSVGRLVEVLIDAGAIRTEDALYIAGMGSKPNSPRAEFTDPAKFFPKLKES